MTSEAPLCPLLILPEARGVDGNIGFTVKELFFTIRADLSFEV